MSRAESNNSFPKLSLRSILVFSLISQIAVAVGLTGYLSWKNGQKIVKSLAMSSSREITAHTKNRVDSFFNIPTIFLKINQSFAKLENLNVDNFSDLERNFWLQTQLTSQVNTIYYGSEEGNFLQIEMYDRPKISIRDRATAPNWEIYNLDDRGNKTTLIASERYDPRLRPWYKAAIEAEGIIWSPVYLFSDPTVLGITSAIPIIDRQTGTPKGVMAIDLTLQEISKFLSELEISPSGRTLIVQSSGEVVATSTGENLANNALETNRRLNSTNISDKLISSTVAILTRRIEDFSKITTERQLVLRVNNRRHFVQITPLTDFPGLNWLAIVIIPESDFSEYTRKNTYITLALCSIALVLATVLGAIANQWIFRSITSLSQACEAISRGEFDRIVDLPKIKELAIVALSVNSLAQQVQNSDEANLWVEQRVEEKTRQLQLENQELKRLAVIDSLTGIFNRYYFDLTLNQLWWKNLIDKKPISLIICDVDYFKAYNDLYGHLQGDVCLRQVAQTIENILQRKDDIVARYGGEEFVIILPNTNASGAMEIATKIKEEMRSRDITHAASQTSDRITMSYGVATMIPTAELNSNQFIERADFALYEAKRQGRDRIVFRDRI